MTGITEVVLPMEDRLKKIEETEAAKRRMLSAASKRCVGVWAAGGAVGQAINVAVMAHETSSAWQFPRAGLGPSKIGS